MMIKSFLGNRSINAVKYRVMQWQSVNIRKSSRFSFVKFKKKKNLYIFNDEMKFMQSHTEKKIMNLTKILPTMNIHINKIFSVVYLFNLFNLFCIN